MQRGDRSLDVIFGHRRTGCRSIEQRHALGDEAPIPPRSILLEERAEIAGTVDARRQPRGMEMHERGECERRRRRRQGMIDEQRRQTHRLVAQIGPDRRLGRRAVIPLVEQQVQRAMNRGQAGSEIGIAEIEQPLRSGQHFLCPHNPLLRRRRGDEKRRGDLVDAESAQDVKDQRDLRLLG